MRARDGSIEDKLFEENGEGAGVDFHGGEHATVYRGRDKMADDSYYVRKRSTRPGKKWMVRVPTSSGRGKVVHFGDSSMQDFTQHKDTDRRERYRNRHQRDNLDDPGSPGFWSWYALWGDSSNISTAFASAVRRAKKLGGARRNPTDDLSAWLDRLAPPGQSKAIGPETGRFKLDGISKLKSPHGSVRYVYAEGGEILAALQLLTTDGRTALAVSVFTKPQARRLGLARKLLSAAREDFDSVELSEDRTEEGTAWAAAVKNPGAGALHERFAELCDQIATPATLVIDEEAALAGRDPRSRRAFAATDGQTVYVRPSLAEQKVERIDGVLMHELGHVILMQHGYDDHTERECDACAEGAFGVAICYDADDVQTTGLGVRPRPAHLDLRRNPHDDDGCGC